MSDTLKKYTVLKAISFRGDRIEVNSVIHATDEEALNIGIGEYLSPVEAQIAEEEVATPTPEAGENDATPKETSTEATPEATAPEASEVATPETAPEATAEATTEAAPEADAPEASIEETRVEETTTGTEAETPSEDVAA